MFKGPLEYSIIKNAKDAGLVNINYLNIRDFGIGKHRTVDDRPYGGGIGMIVRVDVLNKAIEFAKKQYPKSKIILLDPVGKIFNQKKTKELSTLSHLILLCGHYEGIDARIRNFVDEVISVGDFILTGGEIPAMLIVDSVVRLLPGVLAKNAVDEESFSGSEKGTQYLEYPQYTRPKTYRNLKVPKILLSGDHKKIEEWRRKESFKITLKVRSDLIKKEN